MKTRMKLVAVTVAGALAAAEPGLAAVMVVPRAAGTAPVPIAPGAILAPAGGISSSLPTMSGTLALPGARPTLPTAAVLRPGTNATPLVAASASHPALSAAGAALPRAAAAVRAEEGAAAEGRTPAGPAPLIKEARTDFRQRLASLSRGIEGIVAHQAVSEQFGKLGRLFDSQAGQGILRALAPVVEAGAADPRWGERLWERLRDGADPALFGPIRDAINEHPADKQSGYALQYLYFFPIDMALPVLKEHLDGPFRGQVLMALKSYAVLATNPAQRRTADLHIYGEIKGMLPSNHALVDPEIEAALLKTFKGVAPKQQALFFTGDERTYAMDLMAVIPNRAFAAAAQQYLNENWLDAEWLYEGVAADGGRIPSNPFAWLQGALDIAAAQADARDAAFLASLGAKLKGRLGEIRKAREGRYESLAKAGKLYLGWYKPYDRRLESLARVHAAVLRAIAAIQPAGRKSAPGSSSRLFAGAAMANAGGLNAVAAGELREGGKHRRPPLTKFDHPELVGPAVAKIRQLFSGVKMWTSYAIFAPKTGPTESLVSVHVSPTGTPQADRVTLEIGYRWGHSDSWSTEYVTLVAGDRPALLIQNEIDEVPFETGDKMPKTGLIKNAELSVGETSVVLRMETKDGSETSYEMALQPGGNLQFSENSGAGSVRITLPKRDAGRRAAGKTAPGTPARRIFDAPGAGGSSNAVDAERERGYAVVPEPAGGPERGGSAGNALRKMNALALAGAFTGALLGPLVPAAFLLAGLLGSGLADAALMAADARWRIFDHPAAGTAFRAAAMATAFAFFGASAGLLTHGLGAVFGSAPASAGAAGVVAGGLVPTLVDVLPS